MTENHKYKTPTAGTTDWHIPLNENFEFLDADVEIRDAAENRSDYEPKESAKFLATDTGERFIGDGDQWTKLPYPGSNDGNTTKNYNGDRPLVSTGRTNVTVDANGGGDYDSIQAAIDNELPWLIRHRVNINVRSGTYNEHVVVPPYMANWTASPSQSDAGERVPIQITGDQSTPNNCQLSSFTASGGIGSLQLRGFEFTSNTSDGGLDNEGAHVASYHTDRVDLVNCKSGGNAKRFIIAYNGRVATRQRIDVGDGQLREYVKVKNMGRYQTGGGSSVVGHVTGNAHVVDNGTVHFNSDNNSTLTGDNGLVRQFSGPQNDSGYAYDAGNGRFWLPGEARGIVVRDTNTGDETEIVVTNGTVTANQL